MCNNYNYFLINSLFLLRTKIKKINKPFMCQYLDTKFKLKNSTLNIILLKKFNKLIKKKNY